MPRFDMASAVSEVFVLGAPNCSRWHCRRATRAFVTEIERDYDGDAFMRPLGSSAMHETERRPGPTDRGQPPHAFVIYQRRG